MANCLNHLRLPPESARVVCWLQLFSVLRLDSIQLCRCTMGTTVGSSKFTDQDYADDAVLFSDCPSKWPYILSSFDEAAHTMVLNTSWSKTKIQNLGHGATPAPVQLQGPIVESTDQTGSHILAVISTRLSVPLHRYLGASV